MTGHRGDRTRRRILTLSVQVESDLTRFRLERGVVQQVSSGDSRLCPDCGSTDVELTHRGYAGPTDERHQHFRCGNCGRVTFEIISRSAREMKLDRVETGQKIDAEGYSYRVMRVLKIGLDEYLLYVRPESSPGRSQHQTRE